tara:strand:- start:2978 stop:3130 length:153 start_codon:yes stop_codon:yes gene_type:complete
MLDTILELLSKDDYFGRTENIEIAKGKYKLTTKIKEKKEQLKRGKAWQRK